VIRRLRLNPKLAAAALLGFASALPFVFLTGTLSAWFSELGISMTMIGLLSSITLAYGFKLLWAPLVRRDLHRWMALSQIGLAAAFAGLAQTDPLSALSQFALIGFCAAILAATYDTAFEAWRIRVADAAAPVELIMTASQIGARAGVLVAGAAALWFSALVGWAPVAWGLAAIFALFGVVMLGWPVICIADDSSTQEAATFPQNTMQQLVAVVCSMAGLAIAMWQVASFIARISVASGDQQRQIESFTQVSGPLIIAMVVIVPILAGRLGLFAAERLPPWSPPPDMAERIGAIHEAVVAPFAELSHRFGVRLLLLLAFVALYTLPWFSWAGFTLPLYLRELGFAKPEVAMAARLYGSVPTAIGILLGGLALVRLPRRDALLIGALLPLLANLAYIDLAQGSDGLRAIVDTAARHLPPSARANIEYLGPLYLAITVKNLCAGIASAIFVGFLASLVAPRHATAQCAIFASLSFVTGAIASALTGQMIDEHGFAGMLRYASALAPVAAMLALWISRAPEPASSVN